MSPDVASQGRTLDAARKNIAEAIALWIESFGEPERVLGLGYSRPGVLPV